MLTPASTGHHGARPPHPNACRGIVTQVHSEILASMMLHLMPPDAFKAACVCKSWHAAVVLSGRLRTVMTIGSKDYSWSVAALSRLFIAFPHLQELHMTTEQLLPMDAISTIARHFSSTLRSLSAFIVSNSVQGEQPAITEIAKITSLESLSLEGTLLTGHSLVQLGRSCPRLRKLYCHEILASHGEIKTLLDQCTALEMLWGLNVSLHNEIDGVPREPVAPLLQTVARVQSLGLNIFEEHDAAIIKCIADIAGHNLASLRMRACRFSSSALLYAAAHFARLESLSVVAWNDPSGSGEGNGRHLRALDILFSRLPPRALSTLRSLELDELSVTDHGMAALARHNVALQLTSLECLDLKEASSDTYTCLLSSLSNLRRLRLGVVSCTAGDGIGRGGLPARGRDGRNSCYYMRWRGETADPEDMQYLGRCLEARDGLEDAGKCQEGTSRSREVGCGERAVWEREARGDGGATLIQDVDLCPIPFHSPSPSAASSSPPTPLLSDDPELFPLSPPNSSRDDVLHLHRFDLGLKGARGGGQAPRDTWSWLSTATGVDHGMQPCLERLEVLSICWYPSTRGGPGSDDEGGGEEKDAAEEPGRAILIAGLGALPKLTSLELSDWPVLVRSDLEELVCSASSLSRFTLSLPQRVSIDSLHGLLHRGSRLRILRVIAFAECLQHDLADAADGVCSTLDAEADLPDRPSTASAFTPALPRLQSENDLAAAGSSGAQTGKADGLDRLRQAFQQQLPGCHCWFDVH